MDERVAQYFSLYSRLFWLTGQRQNRGRGHFRQRAAAFGRFVGPRRIGDGGGADRRRRRHQTKEPQKRDALRFGAEVGLRARLDATGGQRGPKNAREIDENRRPRSTPGASLIRLAAKTRQGRVSVGDRCPRNQAG